MNSPRPIELLAPARNAATAIAAIGHGADAVYIGPPANGARAAAANSLDDIAAVVDYAHRFDARVYATVNTIIYESELKAVEQMITDLYRRGVDAIIVQDMAVLRMDIPPIALHASTQCDIRTPEKALFLQNAGFSQIVPARELSLSETAAICSAVNVPVEVFVHGALCVSYSGDCYASLAVTGRSANRGECAQICRLPFTLLDADGNELIRNRHLLSLRDLNRSADIGALLEAGVSSFKIEGRLKDIAYVKNVVASYRRTIDSIIDANPQLYTRSSSGSCTYNFTPALDKSFNRGFTSYFTRSTAPTPPMASFATPKWVGEKIGTVKKCTPAFIELKSVAQLSNGDGLGYFDTDGTLRGFRVNRAEGCRIFPATKMNIPVGTVIYRNNDKAWSDTMNGTTAVRKIDISMVLRPTPSGIALDITDADGNTASAAAQCALETARTPQQQRHRDTLEKTGDTPYAVIAVEDSASSLFIPASVLTRLRRDAVTALDRARSVAHRYIYHRPVAVPRLHPHTALTYRDNVANHLAREFYTAAGAESIAPALETDTAALKPGTILMTTRYCLRRECGKCLRTPAGADWRGPLTLRSADYTFTLDFDCKECRMNLRAGSLLDGNRANPCIKKL